MPKPRSSLDKPPNLFTDDELSGEEVDVIWNVNISLRRLMEYTDDFRAALALFDSCNNGLAADYKAPWLRKWREMAGRDGGMSLWHFGRTIEGVLELVGQYPILTNRTDPDVVGAEVANARANPPCHRAPIRFFHQPTKSSQAFRPDISWRQRNPLGPIDWPPIQIHH